MQSKMYAGQPYLLNSNSALSIPTYLKFTYLKFEQYLAESTHFNTTKIIHTTYIRRNLYISVVLYLVCTFQISSV